MRSASALPFLITAAAAWPRDAGACADFPPMELTTTFDGTLLEEATLNELPCDMSRAGFSGGCVDCATHEVREDYAKHLGAGVSPDEWAKVLLEAPLPAIDALILLLQGKQKAPPVGLSVETLAATGGAARKRLMSALFFAGFARPVGRARAARGARPRRPAPTPRPR